MLRTLNLACVTKSVHRKSVPKYDALFLALHALCILIAAFSRARSSTSSSMITLRLCRSRERRAVVEVGLIEAFRGSAVGSTTSRSVGSLSMKVCVDLKALKSCTSTYTHSSVVRSSGWPPRSSTRTRRDTIPRLISGVLAVSCSRCGLARDRGVAERPWLFCSRCVRI